MNLCPLESYIYLHLQLAVVDATVINVVVASLEEEILVKPVIKAQTIDALLGF